MTTEADLLKAILNDPFNDGLRLIYADFIEESQPERAEFIRCQIEHRSIPIHECDRIYPGCTVDMSGPYVSHNHKCRGYRPQQRYIELWDKHGKEWFGEIEGKMNVVRGFPSKIKCTMAEFLGPIECELCGRTGHEYYRSYDGTEEGSITVGPCSSCDGYSLAKSLFEQVPITEVEFTGYELWESRNVYSFWRLLAWEELIRIGENSKGNLHDCLFDEMWAMYPDQCQGFVEFTRNHQIVFRTELKCKTALSHAAVSYGRKQAGLSPIVWPKGIA